MSIYAISILAIGVKIEKINELTIIVNCNGRTLIHSLYHGSPSLQVLFIYVTLVAPFI